MQCVFAERVSGKAIGNSSRLLAHHCLGFWFTSVVAESFRSLASDAPSVQREVKGYLYFNS